ncbi:Down syndrome cell adhesion molecule-like protein, partial [Leptotrombidium deliense]
IAFPVKLTGLLRDENRNICGLQVSWVRQRDLHIISAGDYIYTSDQRFKPKHVDNTDEWYLHIEYAQKEDSGIYECQVSTEPKMSLSFFLNVIEAKSEILGSAVIQVPPGSTINLTCIINQTASPPLFVYWHRDEKVLSFRDSSADSSNDRIKVNTVKGPTSISVLEIRDAQSSDSGNYSCRPVPQYADPANTTVHVLNGENPAAMQHSNHKNSLTSHSILLTILAFLVLKRRWIVFLIR